MAELQKANITIPLGGVLAEQIDERLLDKGAVAKSENTLFDKHGAVTKAPGAALVAFAPERVGVLLKDGFALESIKDGEREMLLAGGYLEDASDYSYLDEYYQCCALDEQKSVMRSLGFWPPVTQRNRKAVYVENPDVAGVASANIKDPCIARLGGYLWHVWIEIDTIPAVPLKEVYYSVTEEATGVLVVDRTRLFSTIAFDKQQPHIVAVGTTRLHVFASANSILYRVILNPTNPLYHSAVVAATPIAAISIFDICTLVDPTDGAVSCAVFKGTGNHLQAITWKPDGTVLKSATLATNPAFDPMAAVGCARVEDKTTGALGHFLAYAFQDDADAFDDICYGMISEDLTTPHQIANISLVIPNGAVYTVEQLTLAEEPADAWETGAANSAIRIWAGTTQIATGFKRVWTVRAKFVAPGGVVEDEDVSWYHYTLQSKAFYHKGRSHCWLKYTQPSTVLSQSFSPSGVLAAYRETTTRINPLLDLCLPLSVAYNHHLALYGRVDQGLPDVVSAGTDQYMWTTLHKEFLAKKYAEACTIHTDIVDFGVKGLRPASIGPAVLFGGGMVYCFDKQLQDNGFFHGPTIISIIPAAGTGSLTAAGVYQWLVIYEWTDRNGQWHASSPSVPEEVTLVGGQNEVSLEIFPLEAGEWYRNVDQVRINIYRTLAGGSEFHYEGYVDNAPRAYYVTFVSKDGDTTIEVNRLAYTDGSPGSELDNTCPPPMTQIVQHQDRLLGISEENSFDVWFTKPKRAGIAPEFSIYQVKSFPEPLVGLVSQGDYWYAFTEDNQVYAVTGPGPDVFGVSGEFSQPRLLSHGSGCINPRFLEETDIGVLYQSERGIEMLAPDGRVVTISHPVESEFYTDHNLARCVPDSANSRIYVVGLSNSGLMLVYDYKHDRWTTLTARGTYPQDAALYKNILYTLHKDGKIRKASGYQIDGGAIVSMKLGTPWIRAGNLTGFTRVWWANLLGAYLGPHTLRIKQYVDYDQLTVVDQMDFVITAQADGYPYNFRWKPGRRKFAAVKFTVEDMAQTTPYRSADWVAMELTAGFKGPLPKRAKN